MVPQRLLLSLLMLLPILCQAQALDWVQKLGGPNYEVGLDIAVDPSGNVITVGSFGGTCDFDPGIGVFPITVNGVQDVFVSKLDSAGNFLWAESIGGASYDQAWNVRCDAAGNIIIAGDFQGTVDFDPGPSVFNLSSNGGSVDIFYCKLKPNGEFLWAKRVGAIGVDACHALTLDNAGNIYAGGEFSGTVDFDPGTATYNLVGTSGGSKDMYITKLDDIGNFQWARRIGGTGDDFVNDIVCDPSGNLLFTGGFENTVDFDPGPAVTSIPSFGNRDIYIAKLDPGGNFIWAQQMGGMFYDEGVGLSLDASGNIYTSGLFTYTADFDPGLSTFNITGTAGDNPFYTKLDPSGNLIWARAIVNAQNAVPKGIKQDAHGNLVAVGYFSGTADFDLGPGVHNITSEGGYDVYCLIANPQGDYLWSGTISGVDHQIAHAFTTDANYGIYSTGFFLAHTDFDPGLGVLSLGSAGLEDIFIQKLFPCIAPNPPIDTTLPGGLTVCRGGTTTLAVNGIGLLSWYTAPIGGTFLAHGNTFTTAPLSSTTTFYAQDSTCGRSTRLAITVTVLQPTSSNFGATACNSYLSPSGNHIWSSTGTYSDTLINQAGCDSIVTVNLTLASPTTSTLSPTTCSSYLSPSGQTWYTSGTYTDTIPNAAGCDSIITINLTILGSTASTITPTTCAAYTSPSGNHIWTSTGTYQDTIQNISGCDSIITIHLTVTPVNATVTNNSPTLTANTPGATYQWIYCDSGAINGATNQSFTPTITGNYAVIVTQNGCVDTSACELVIITGLQENTPTISAYPNPTHGHVNIDCAGYCEETQLEVRNALGQLLHPQFTIAANKILVDLQGSPGVYFLALQHADGTRTNIKIVKH